MGSSWGRAPSLCSGGCCDDPLAVYTRRVKAFLVKVPEGMLDLWRKAAEKRKVTLSQMIREAVNRDIEKDG